MKPFERLARETVHQNPYWRHLRDRYRMPNMQEADYHFMQSSGSVLIIPQLKDKQLLLVKQYRYIQQQWGWEFPGGGQQAGQTPLETAHIELQEETGYRAETFTHIGRLSPCQGLLDEWCEIYLAQDLTRGQASPEASEDIKLLKVTQQQLEAAICEGKMWSGMSQAAWLHFKLHQG
ncbi:MAG TPA: hypothetical protein DCE42_29400 [Myxococcales bacterium]|nr:hypothetical protein [Deltaproteobacteria bacterium]MBU48555.1 hypothetical protein [Deltaproteobacteria bacterium]HAA58909.1 hypothetical protein [Myxococcales bacterium]|tara:strand:- start:2545 stop:3075 length:531 start_codon:yes stop_codon:yes gene_type:complete